VHRAESTESKAALAEIVEFLRRQARDRIIVFPLHPRTRKRIAEWRLDLGDILACEPLGYLDMHRLLRSAVAVFTDSGGLQRKPISTKFLA
jgi:UDP-N-acetylglucosamine 2-epimerase